jgi:maltose alpha-D-glucosyltransferase / alpha-amylase
VPSEPGTLLMKYEWQDHALIIAHNFNAAPVTLKIDPRTAGNRVLVDLLWTNDSRAKESGRHIVELEAYAYRWFRAGSRDRDV